MGAFVGYVLVIDSGIKGGKLWEPLNPFLAQQPRQSTIF